MNIPNLKTVIFDFDGVLVESLDVKGEAFVQLYKDQSEAIQNKVLQYHIENGGVTRHDKIRYYEGTLCNRVVHDELIQTRAAEFSDIVENRVVACDPVEGAMGALESLKDMGVPLYIVSATPQDELIRIVKSRKMNQYFDGIFGAPKTKAEHIGVVLQTLKIVPGSAVMIGDAMSDYKAATETGVHFIGRELSGQTHPFPAGTTVLPNLNNLLNVLGDL